MEAGEKLSLFHYLQIIQMFLSPNTTELYRFSQSAVFNSGQKMAPRTFHSIMTLTKNPSYYYIDRSQHHLLAVYEKLNTINLDVLCGLPYTVYSKVSNKRTVYAYLFPKKNPL